MNFEKESQNTREKIILAVYAIYTVAMAGVVFLFQWDSWIVPVILGGLAVCVLMYLKQYQSYIFRAFATTTMMWINFSIYFMYGEDFTGAFSTMASMIILLAIYCIPQLSYVGVTIYTLHLFYHFIFVQDIWIDLTVSGVETLMRIASVYVALYVTYQIMKAQVENNEVMLENIETIRNAEQSKDDFMANMSHEIRTPINTVCGISEMVLRENLPESARDGIMDIQNAGRQLLSLVSDILDFSELSSGKMEIVADTYNITSTVNDILNMALAKAAGKNIEIIVDCDANIPCGLVGDEQKIRRAIMNVLDNAIKFTEEGGVLFNIAFREEEYGGNLIVTVQDTGIGMTEEQLDTMFESFHQVDAKRNRRVSGIGLGLSIAKIIVNRMGGFISIKSVYGQGTQVQMVFPQEVNAGEPVAVLNRSEGCRAMLYLDVEKYNNAIVRDGYVKCIQHMVKQLGLYYRHARTLAECKRRIENEDFDYLFVSWKEYCEDKDYFEGLSEKMNVVLVLERDHKESILGSRLLCVYKPFYVLTIASVLNGQYVEYVGRHVGRNTRFIAPEASVLVVDDNLMNLKVVEGLLRPYKLKVFVAESGKEAIKKVEGAHFDIVFMDHMMPEMDGIETFHRIRQKPGQYFQTVPIVALTANAIGGAREMFLQEGFADYVAKPIELSSLERVLLRFIPEEKRILDFEEETEEADAQSQSGLAGGNSSGNQGGPAGRNASGNQSESDGRNFSGSINELYGIDRELGINYCGGKLNDYLDVLRTYYEIGQTKIEAIRKSFEAQNIEDYTILVHAVKSTSLNIGATHLSEMAKNLEAAGKNGNKSYIDEHSEEMLAEYEKVLSAIGGEESIFPEEEAEEVLDARDLEKMEQDALLEKISALEKLVAGFDSEAALTCLRELHSFQYDGKPLKTMLSEVEKRIDDFEYMEAGEELTKLKESIRG